MVSKINKDHIEKFDPKPQMPFVIALIWSYLTPIFLGLYTSVYNLTKVFFTSIVGFLINLILFLLLIKMIIPNYRFADVYGSHLTLSNVFGFTVVNILLIFHEFTTLNFEYQTFLLWLSFVFFIGMIICIVVLIVSLLLGNVNELFEHRPSFINKR